MMALPLDPPAWVAEYIGKPFEDKGRGPDTFDCWGLVKGVLQQQFGQHGLPDYLDGYDSAKDRTVARLLSMERARWSQVETPQLGDVVLIRVLGRPQHVGIVVARNMMLHTDRGTESCLEYIDSPRWRSRVEGYFRHPG